MIVNIPAVGLLCWSNASDLCSLPGVEVVVATALQPVSEGLGEWARAG